LLGVINEDMTKRSTIKFGLSFPNAILFGLLYVILGIVVLYQVIEDIGIGVILVLIFVFILGLVPLTTFRRIRIRKETNEIYCFNKFLFFFKIGNKYRLDEFDRVIVGTKIRTYAAGGGFLITAQSFNRIKETDIWIVKSGTRHRIEIKNVGSKKRTQRIVDEILNLSDLKL
jgi:hypothetical protein